jgi:hypothetical protein
MCWFGWNMQGAVDRMSKTETVQDFKSIMDFLNFCYFDCKLKKRGCMNTCQIRVEMRKRHPDWFGA